MKILNEKCSPLEDKKSATFFGIIDDISKIGGPLIVQYSTLIFIDDMEDEVSKLKDKWVREFDSFPKSSK